MACPGGPTSRPKCRRTAGGCGWTPPGAVTDLAHPGYERWRTLVAEDPDAVLGGFPILDGPDLDRPLLLTVRMRHAISELTLHDLATGAVVAEVPTPGPGTSSDRTTRCSSGGWWPGPRTARRSGIPPTRRWCTRSSGATAGSASSTPARWR